MITKKLELNDLVKYPSLEIGDYEIISQHHDDGLLRTDCLVHTPFDDKRVAEIIRPEKDPIHSAVIFIHWYEPAEPKTSNRFQFVEEAKELARKGSICLCVETLWSDLDFFFKRKQCDDIQNSLKEIINLRRFLDLLFLQVEIQPSRTLLVGHDFGGMFGILLGSIDERIKNFVIMSATARFSDWYLYFPELEEKEKEKFRDEIKPLDPLEVIPEIKDASFLLQFGKQDPHVPIDNARELISAAPLPKDIQWYEAGHGLNDLARIDRIKWIKKRLYE